jgi:predicted site-specific integrase-resolvase
MLMEKSYRLPARDVAKRLGVHVETVKRWARDGKVEGRKNMAGAWVFAETDIDVLPVHVVTEEIEG